MLAQQLALPSDTTPKIAVDIEGQVSQARALFSKLLLTSRPQLTGAAQQSFHPTRRYEANATDGSVWAMTSVDEGLNGAGNARLRLYKESACILHAPGMSCSGLQLMTWLARQASAALCAFPLLIPSS